MDVRQSERARIPSSRLGSGVGNLGYGHHDLPFPGTLLWQSAQICIAVFLPLTLSSVAEAQTGTWKGATVFLTEKPADSETANSTPRAFTVTSESANAKSIELSDGQRNSPEFAKDDLGKRFVLLDGAATYFRAQLVADPMNAFALQSLALVETQFGQTVWGNLDTQKAAEMGNALPGEPGQSRVDWTLWVHYRVIPPEIYAVPAPEYVNLAQQFQSGCPCSPWASNSITPTGPVTPHQSGPPAEPAPAPPASSETPTPQTPAVPDASGAPTRFKLAPAPRAMP